MTEERKVERRASKREVRRSEMTMALPEPQETGRVIDLSGILHVGE